MRFFKWSLILGLFVAIFAQIVSAAPPHFYLHNGDRVLFYGDSITEQRYYPVAIETYIRTRFPNLQVKFVDSAVGGARVTGNWTVSSEDESLERDVFPFKPNVVTIMLGMNDAGYRPFDQTYFNTYTTGYEHIVESLQAHLPGVRIVLIEPTPWDDVTVKPSYSYNPQNLPGGYNSTLLHYCQFVRELGARHHLLVVDFNTPLVKLMEEAEKSDPSLAGKIIPGRVHPGATGELVMAQLLLKAWGAPETVTRVEINAMDHTSDRAVNTTVSGLRGGLRSIAWTQNDKALPYPIMTLHSTKWPQFPPDPFGREATSMFWKLPPLTGTEINPVAALVTRLMKMYDELDSETLKVSGLQAPAYTLKTDGEPVGTFTRGQLAEGINLAQYETPMMDQADKTLDLVWREMDARFYAWRAVQVPLKDDKTPGIQDAVNQLLARLMQEKNNLAAQAQAAVQPQPHQYELEPVGMQ
ncbi:MAG TPA: SGNH/GDSL hydrolase family protein [Terriglobia bacterium]|nr:SGNH/GDSL hydrolase family protein [Terriglobia bacterium]